VQGIVRAHEGCIFAESTLDEGTVFYVMLPAIATAAYEPVQAPSPRPQSEVQGSHVLVVDDEDIVLSITKRMLERRGLRVSTFSSASKALEYYREEYRTIDAVLFDITMPVLSGGDFVRAVHEINPEARCIAASGFEQEVALEEIDSSLISSFLHKPFQFHSLLGAIEDAIKGNGAL
jgi:DNA-binding NtrC family response regulator